MGVTTTLDQTVVRLDPSDPVALARIDLQAGLELDAGDGSLRLRDEVPRGHKLALVDIASGTEVRKYGQPIGLASRDILAGEHVHSHNLHSLSRVGGARTLQQISPAAAGPSDAFGQERSFAGSSAPTGASGHATTSRS